MRHAGLAEIHEEKQEEAARRGLERKKTRKMKERKTWCRNYRAFERYRNLKNKRKKTIKEVIWIWGPTKTGKSELAHELAGDDYYDKLPENKWFDSYDGDHTVLFDDFRPTWCSFGYMLRLLDNYPLQVETKGGTTAWLPHRIIITCPKSPEDCFDTTEDVNRLLRRITTIIDKTPR